MYFIASIAIVNSDQTGDFLGNERANKFDIFVCAGEHQTRITVLYT